MQASTFRLWRALRTVFLIACGTAMPAWAAAADPLGPNEIDLADMPLFSTTAVPGNLALALSMDPAIASTAAYNQAYSLNDEYIGYFDPKKCYEYKYNQSMPEKSYFEPYGWAKQDHSCPETWATPTGGRRLPLWSGNYMNWATMQTIDIIRWKLTGGYRSVDTPDETILTKAYSLPNVGNNFNAYKYAAIHGNEIPINWQVVTSLVGGLGIEMRFNEMQMMFFPGVRDYSNNEYESSSAVPMHSFRVYINVKVCVWGILKEANCVRYGSRYKPEGLLQKYADRLRYSVFGYYNGPQLSPPRDGGVMRARMKFIGPSQPKPGSKPTANPNAEWDASTGVMSTNPDGVDAAATVADAAVEGATVSITQSGVMNYLNKFGYFSEKYPVRQPVGELYYAVSRYFRNKGNVAAYSTLKGVNSSTAASYLDGFPGIRNWDDPILYTCQKNFILGIGDVATSRNLSAYNDASHTVTTAFNDASAPGSILVQQGTTLGTINGDDLSNIGANDDKPDGLMKDVMVSTGMVSQLEGLTGTFSMNWNRCGGAPSTTNFLAGMAYDMHVRDIRPDLPGFQSINTYWIDMDRSSYCHKNQFWLAAKYGGFAVPKVGFRPYDSNNSPAMLRDELWADTSSSARLPFAGMLFEAPYSFSTDTGQTDKVPTNYFHDDFAVPAVRDGLTRAFAKIASESAMAGASAATSTALAPLSPKLKASGVANYAASYDASTWTGTLKGQMLVFDSNGKPGLKDVWRTDETMQVRDWTSRQIVTYCNGHGVPFRPGMGCTSSFDQVDGVSPQSVDNYINYLRGDTGQEIGKGGVYRSRTSLLGDIVDAKVVSVAAPNMRLSDQYNPGYANFKSRYAMREPMVYVGANDGMMHAFDGSVTTTSGGKEVFAYVPGLAYASAYAGLATFGSPLFTHHYFVNGTPNVFDIDFRRAGTSGAASTDSDWHSVLIGGLGKGGKGYYAIDVTDPDSWNSESDVAGKVLWEFGLGSRNDVRATPYIGYSYGDAVVVKTAKYGWVVILTSGYSNSDGRGYFFFVDPRTGVLLETVVTPAGSATEYLHMAKASAFVPNYRDGTADAIYAGDLRGNVWRLDLTARSGNYAAPTKIAILKDAHGVVQPITTRPLIEIDPASGKRYVLIGTGRLLAESDALSAQVQSFYAIIDGSGQAGGFYGGSTSLPAGVRFPITRARLEENRSLVAGIGSNPAKTLGWYFDMPVSSNIAERVNVDPTVENGVVAWAGNLPKGQVCGLSGASTIHAVSIGQGKSTLTDASGNAVANVEQNKIAIDLAFDDVDGTRHLLVGNSDGTVVDLQGKFGGGRSFTMKQLDWRVLPTVD